MWRSPGGDGDVRLKPDATVGRRRRGPHGPRPTGIFFVTMFVARSTIDTSPDGPFAVNSFVPSGESAMPHGRWPTSTVPATLFVAVSIV